MWRLYRGLAYPRQVHLEAELLEEILRLALAARLQLRGDPVRH
jgi:hypothetical protein